jgi:hypothetical protein
VRASILFWSTVSGVILGLFVDALVVGAALLLSTIVPLGALKAHQRWLTMVAAIVFVLVPAAFAVLGYLEGRLKAV